MQTALWCAGARRHHRPRWKQYAGELVTPYGDRIVHQSRTIYDVRGRALMVTWWLRWD